MSDSPNFTPATVVYQGTYKGATVSGRVPVWSLPTAPDETARLLYAVITGRSLHKEGRRINWACGAEDFSAWVPTARRDGGRVTNFLHFTFRIEMNPSQSAPRGVRRHPSDKAPTPAPTFTDDVPEPASPPLGRVGQGRPIGRDLPPHGFGRRRFHRLVVPPLVVQDPRRCHRVAVVPRG